MRPPNVTLKFRKARRNNKKAVSVYQSANKRFATQSVETVSANKSIRLSNDFNPSHRLSRDWMMQIGFLVYLHD